jgi:hypothetical protein
MPAVAEARPQLHSLLTDRTRRIADRNVVLESGSKLSGRGRNLDILKIPVRRLPIALAKRNVHDNALRRRGLENASHQSKNVLGHACAITDDATANGLGKNGCDTEKNSVSLKKISDNGDNAMRHCIFHYVSSASTRKLLSS